MLSYTRRSEGAIINLCSVTINLLAIRVVWFGLTNIFAEWYTQHHTALVQSAESHTGRLRIACTQVRVHIMIDRSIMMYALTLFTLHCCRSHSLL